MQGWITGFQESIDFIEQNLTKEMDTEEIASKAALSPFYYQRIFGALCGMTVGEYIRARRMMTFLRRESMWILSAVKHYSRQVINMIRAVDGLPSQNRLQRARYRRGWIIPTE